MIKIKSSINILNKEFENLKLEMNKEKILSSKIQKNILNIQKKIQQTHSQLYQSGIHYNLKDIVKINDLKEELENLKLNIHFFQAKLPIHFKARETRNFLKQGIDLIFGKIFNTLNYPIRKFIFQTAALKKAHPKIQKKLSQLKEQQAANQKKLQVLNDELLKCKNSKKNTSIKKNIERLEIKINHVNDKIMPLENKIKLDISHGIAGDQLRRAAVHIGGERVTLTTSDNVQLDGLFLDGLKFRKKLSNIGCKHTVLSCDSFKMNALVLNREDYFFNGDELINSLNAFHAFAEKSTNLNREGAGWQIVFHKDKVYIVSDDQLPNSRFEAGNHPFFQFNDESRQWEIRESAINFIAEDPKQIDIDHPATGTVIITSGNLGVYEMHKTEAAFFLMQNMNVMLFNFRGHSLSRGTPTRTGLKLDMECAYQYAKQRSKHQDKQILFKALCLSGFVASYVASQHPDTNILLDQTYSNFRTIFKEKTQEKLKKRLKNDSKISKKVIKLFGNLATLFSPNINTSKYFSKNRGKKAIFYAINDELLGMKHLKENIKAVFQSNQDNLLFIAPILGNHGTSIIHVKSLHSQALLIEEKGKLLKKMKKLDEEERVLLNKLKNEMNIEKQEKLTKELKQLEIKINITVLEIDDFVKNSKFYSGKKQLEYFLKKAELSSPLI